MGKLVCPSLFCCICLGGVGGTKCERIGRAWRGQKDEVEERLSECFHKPFRKQYQPRTHKVRNMSIFFSRGLRKYDNSGPFSAYISYIALWYMFPIRCDVYFLFFLFLSCTDDSHEALLLQYSADTNLSI